ncbi:MAG: DUF3472 domain-containing protein [Akkermansiaceae bacterium]
MRSIILFLVLSAPLIADQRDQPVERIKDGEVVYLAQKTKNSTLVLDANSVYFSGALTAAGKGEGTLPSPELNQNKNFTHVTGWDSSEDEMRWHLWLSNKGKVSLQTWLEAAQGSSKAEMVFELSKGRDSKAITQTITPSDAKSAQPWKVGFNIQSPGKYTLTLKGKSGGAGEIGKLHRIQLTGEAVTDAALLRSRWRPGAVHAGSFSSSASKESPDLIVMEVRPRITTHSAYAPVTTPFGYYGSSFLPGGKIRGLNFSMWSFGRGKESPPLDKLSRLLAVGSPKAKFGGFSHEGTGVKVRGWDPWAGGERKTQRLALRREVQGRLTTYYGYFYDDAANEWKLYAVGRQPSKGKRERGLSVGAFVEVPGAAQRQRTGDISREVHYRGWAQTKGGSWRVLDTMAGPMRTKGIHNKQWAITADGWFSMSMGGMEHYSYPRQGQAAAALKLPNNDSKLPAFLSDAATSVLYQLPASVHSIKLTADGKLSFQINAKSPGDLTIYYGNEDGLVFPAKWKHKRIMKGVKPGKHQVQLDGAAHCRLFFANKDAQVWAFETTNAEER